MRIDFTSKYTGHEIEERLDRVGAVMPFTYIAKRAPYLYELAFDSLDYTHAREYFEGYAPEPIGGCSSIVSNGLAGRNYDWKYDHLASFIVHTARAQGRHAVYGIAEGMPELTEEFVESRAYSKDYVLLPFRLHDGQNECGLYAEVNVVPSRENTATVPLIEKRDRICASMLVRYVLDHFATVDEAISYLQNYVEIFMPANMAEMGYELHFTLADVTKTRVIEFIDNAIVVIDNNKSTNYHLYGVNFNADGSVYTNVDVSDGNLPSSLGIENDGAGLERWNILNAGNVTDLSSMRALMRSLYYTNAYTDLGNVWYSEFVGGGVTVDTSVDDTELLANIELARLAYSGRDRDTAYTWQSVHSVIYDLANFKAYVTVQEDYDNEIVFGLKEYYTAAEVDGKLENIDALPPQEGHAGEVLSTDGTTASWVPMGAEGRKYLIPSPISPFVVTHNLGRYPSVTVIDTLGNEVEAEIMHSNMNSLTVSWNGSLEGYVFIV